MPTPPSFNLRPDRPSISARQLPELAGIFLSDLAKRSAPVTVRNYRFTLNRVLEWWTEAGPACGWILDENTLADFGAHVRALTYAQSYKAQICSKLRQLLRWAHRHGYAHVDLSEFVPSIKGTPRVRPPVSVDVVGELLAACTGRYELRNRAIIATLAGTGIRCMECAALRICDVRLADDNCGTLSVQTAKLAKPRLVAFDTYTGHYVAAYLTRDSPLDGGEPLFPSHRGGHFRPNSLYRVLRDIAVAAGVADKIRGPHDLRRLFATQWARQRPGPGYGALLQRQMGHASYAMTSSYLLSDVGDIAEVMRSGRVSPVAAVSRSH